jgi:hypothetical protein
VLTTGQPRAERGSVLMLMPAALLAVLVLAAITVDLSVVHLARADLVGAATAGANDAATYGLSEEALRRDGALVLDPVRVEIAVHRSLAARGALPHLTDPPEISVGDGGEITVRLTRRVGYVFAKALPGSRSTTVEATGTATTASR